VGLASNWLASQCNERAKFARIWKDMEIRAKSGHFRGESAAERIVLDVLA
jgi:hypothetical protein